MQVGLFGGICGRQYSSTPTEIGFTNSCIAYPESPALSDALPIPLAARAHAARTSHCSFTPNRAVALANDYTLLSSLESHHRPSARPPVFVRQHRRRH